VYIVPGLSDGTLDLAGATVIRQGHAGVPGIPEPGDNFGQSIGAAPLGEYFAIGAPGEDVDAARDAGAITVFHHGASNGKQYVQGVSGVPGRPESGDLFGYAVEGYDSGSLAVGVPGEDVAGLTDTGQVVAFVDEILGYQIPGSAGKIAYQQGSVVDIPLRPPPPRTLPGVPESGDFFGAMLANRGSVGLTIGMPGEDITFAGTNRVDAGAAIDWAYYPTGGLVELDWPLIHRGHDGLSGEPRPYDYFGFAGVAFGVELAGRRRR
jgi:hypothetical protein